MTDWKRYFVNGGSYFFTVVTHKRRAIFGDDNARQILGKVLRECKVRWPFSCDAVVLLPDHMHAIWSLPAGDHEYSKRWGWLKKEFSKRWLQTGGTEIHQSQGRHRGRRAGVWQAKFWEHTIECETEYQRCFDYLHYNPVKHGLADRPADWQWSSFHQCVKRGIYEKEWGRNRRDPQFDFNDLNDFVGE